MRVKDMSRRQQKAVFASIGNPGSLRERNERDKIIRKEFPNADFDKDGVKNKDDCRPLDRKKHFLGAAALAVGASYVGSRLSRSTEKKKDNSSQGEIRNLITRFRLSEFKQIIVERKAAIEKTKINIKSLQKRRKHLLKLGQTVKAQKPLEAIQAQRFNLELHKSELRDAKHNLKKFQAKQKKD